MNKLLNLYFLVAMVSINAQVTYIQGGGTLDDWAHLKKYEKDNMEIKGIDDPNRVVFMGNSITEGWLYFNKSLFLENIAENIFSMAEIALANNIEVFICSVLPAADFPWSPGKNPAEKVIKLNSLLKDYCNKNKLTYVDYYSAMDNGKGGLKVPEHTAADDLVHPNKAGYAVMEGVILKALNN
jgi:hypothetical protein